jgi:drug/metabolite transporter (DMT)-like permease
MPDWIDLLQWPAMVVTVAAGLLVSSERPGRRKAGFISFLVSNVMWVAWGWNDGAYALIALQLCLAVTNVRGLLNNDKNGK